MAKLLGVEITLKRTSIATATLVTGAATLLGMSGTWLLNDRAETKASIIQVTTSVEGMQTRHEYDQKVEAMRATRIDEKLDDVNRKVDLILSHVMNQGTRIAGAP